MVIADVLALYIRAKPVAAVVEVMSTSFMGQALACEYLVRERTKLPPGYMRLPEHLDNRIAALQLAALGVAFDTPTAEQEAYAKSWEAGTE